ncbi:uncharacterized protein YcbK (DUF882 family) [Mesonia hippocampi]|uniref:Uncharacterized protein YcbK (DUF882 family) n=1 Tax=Mesonia hippocampi TaxID=1628250 RepID=A0A840EHE6_9FLAO|nr:D-Ala-D-Ala carboxypeptidase family metallohydrolase [Mesonia hippocampi]MBB4117849.1 uncharacterized protein YcbK (DUF882 family) [Mesonia hippocampi]
MMIDINQQLTKDFTLREFLVSKFYNERQQKKVIASVTPVVLKNIQKLAENLQIIRDEIGVPLIINIAFRPEWWEYLQGRSGKSKHVLGMAADIVCSLSPSELRKVIFKLISEKKIQNGGVGSYATFTHYDIRKIAARW